MGDVKLIQRFLATLLISAAACDGCSDTTCADCVREPGWQVEVDSSGLLDAAVQDATATPDLGSTPADPYRDWPDYMEPDIFEPVTDPPVPLGIECELDAWTCPEGSGCVGRACYEPCSRAECAEGEQCRYGANAEAECHQPWTCEDFIGRGQIAGCSMEWTCAATSYLISCKGPVWDSYQYAGAVDCTCEVDGVQVGHFEWAGYICTGVSSHPDVKQLINTACGWSLPENRSE